MSRNAGYTKETEDDVIDIKIQCSLFLEQAYLNQSESTIMPGLLIEPYVSGNLPKKTINTFGFLP